MREVRFGEGLIGMLYDGGGDRAMIVAGAMGVPRRYYDAFAQFMASQKVNVLTFDYAAPTFAEWGTRDIAAAVDQMKGARELILVGHSAGGQLAPLAHNASAITRFILVTSGSGYWRHWPIPHRWALRALWLAMPPISRMLGYFPSRALRLGSQNIPARVASQWAEWCRNPGYVYGFEGAERHAAIDKPLLAWSFDPDPYAPKRAVDALLAGYRNARIEHRHRRQRGVGHFGFFRKGIGEPLWNETLTWLDRDRPL